MKINSTLEKKLLKYSAMASGVVAMGTVSNAQIVYFDESPDVVITGHQQGSVWDFDGDAANDVSVITFDGSATGTYYGYAYTQYYVAAVGAPYSGAAIMQTTGASADALNLATPINSAASFNTGTQALLGGMFNWKFGTSFPYGTSFNQSAGNWLGATDKYMGFRFTSGGNIHYGWMRMDVTADAVTVTVKDWAYNSVADAPINAGQTVGLYDNVDELALVRFFNNRLEVKTVNGTAGNLTIVNTEGKVVYNNAINNSYESIDLSNFSAGLYIVNAEFAEGAVQHKVIVR